jgi:hypothetical protein
MNARRVLDQLSDLNPEAILLTNMDSALIGVGHIGANEPVAVYSRSLIFAQLKRDGFTEEEANDFYQNTFIGAAITKDTPVIVDDQEEV